jgi:2-dehydro-3-deoxygluconokinase
MICQCRKQNAACRCAEETKCDALQRKPDGLPEGKGSHQRKHNFTSIIYSAKNDTYYRENPYNNIDVVDRIGSGDAYVSGALYGYLKHGDCQKALEYGNAMAAIKHSVIGDMVFTDLEEIDSIIKQHKNTSGYQSEMNR